MSQKQEIVMIDWKPQEKNTLRGFLSLQTPDGLIIREVCLHEKNGKRWVSMPARSYKREDGVIGWQPMVEFANDASRARFQTAALSAFDAYRAEGERKCS
jgi:hypothetical protein